MANRERSNSFNTIKYFILNATTYFTNTDTDREILDVVTEAIATLVQDVDCFLPLSTFGVTEADLDDLVAETNTQVRVMGHSTYQLTSDEIRGIFATAL